MKGRQKKAGVPVVGFPGKIFGVALDASDDPFSLQLKHAAIGAREQGGGLVTDPYEVLADELINRCGLAPGGRFPVPSWLGALPEPRDRHVVTPEVMQRFIDEKGIFTMIHDLKDFVTERILPAIPVMAGIDHAATGGVVSALAEHVGAENLTVIVLDRHFDALPPSVRMAAFGGDGQVVSGASEMPTANEACCCGNFWAHLIEDGTVDPAHLVFLGVADYPPDITPLEWAAFKKAYLAYEGLGCRFFPLRRFEEEAYEERLRRFLSDVLTTPYVYVSLDLDVGSYRAVHAARYMDGPGMDAEAMMLIARTIAEGCRKGVYRLAGLDVMEFNMHLLGLQLPTGGLDRTVRTAVEFAETLLNGRLAPLTPCSARENPS